MKTYNFRITIEQDEDDIFVAKCPALPGCHTQAKTYEQAITRIKEAVGLYLEVLKKKQKQSLLTQTSQPKFFAWQDLAISA